MDAYKRGLDALGRIDAVSYTVMPTASVILCTRNRGRKLEASLHSLAEQATSADETLEILIVDNGSTDDTATIAKRWMQRHPDRFRYVYEPCRGKSHALNRGLRETSAPVVLLLDDDCIAEPGWVAAMLAEFAADPLLEVVGGRVELHDPADRAVTVRTYTDRRVFDSTSQLFALIPGCNLGVRRTLFERIGGFDPELGPGSPQHLVAEDTDFLYRALRAKARMIYTPTACVRHDHGRRTDGAVTVLHRTYIEGRGALYCKHAIAGDRVALRLAYWEVLGSLRAALRNRHTLGDQFRMLRHLTAGAWRWWRGHVRVPQPCTCGASAESVRYEDPR